MVRGTFYLSPGCVPVTRGPCPWGTGFSLSSCVNGRRALARARSPAQPAVHCALLRDGAPPCLFPEPVPTPGAQWGVSPLLLNLTLAWTCDSNLARQASPHPEFHLHTPRQTERMWSAKLSAGSGPGPECCLSDTSPGLGALAVLRPGEQICV